MFEAWTKPDLLKRWFAPRPYTTAKAELDVRVGGTNVIVMQSPEGNQMPSEGIYLEVVQDEKIVFTDAYKKGWEPSAKPFMTVILTFTAVEEGTLYTVLVRHWTVEDKKAHQKMGFQQGWALCTDQLAAVVEQ